MCSRCRRFEKQACEVLRQANARRRQVAAAKTCCMCLRRRRVSAQVSCVGTCSYTQHVALQLLLLGSVVLWHVV